jgi:hypothetical protein
MSVTPVSSPSTAQSACADPQSTQSIAASAVIRSGDPGRFDDEDHVKLNAIAPSLAAVKRRL